MNKQVKHSTQSQGTALRRPSSKAAGTRAGVLQDWRTADMKSGKTSGGSGKTLRDGR